ncbi:hypothetical protein ACOSP6_11070 [Tenacibaculum sp. MEBiC06402]|uniref:hypothetical protein n=1 Tax=unclassified Tenacibaculum TaxID=2635139 RepID=UPI003B99B6C6
MPIKSHCNIPQKFRTQYDWNDSDESWRRQQENKAPSIYTTHETNTLISNLRNEVNFTVQGMKDSLDSVDEELKIKIDNSLENINKMFSKLPEMILQNEELMLKIVQEVSNRMQNQ